MSTVCPFDLLSMAAAGCGRHGQGHRGHLPGDRRGQRSGSCARTSRSTRYCRAFFTRVHQLRAGVRRATARRVHEAAAVFAALEVGDLADPATDAGPPAARRQRDRVEGYIAVWTGRESQGRHGDGRPLGLDKGTLFAQGLQLDAYRPGGDLRAGHLGHRVLRALTTRSPSPTTRSTASGVVYTADRKWASASRLRSGPGRSTSTTRKCGWSSRSADSGSLAGPRGQCRRHPALFRAQDDPGDLSPKRG